MVLPPIPSEHLALMVFTYISSILYIFMVFTLIIDRRKNTRFRSSYYSLFLIHSVADLSLFIYVEFILRPRRFNWFGLFSAEMKAFAKFSFLTMIVLSTAMYLGHAVISLNRFTVFYAPLLHKMMWSRRVLILSAVFIWSPGLVCVMPPFLLFGNQIEFRLLESGIIHMFGGKFSECYLIQFLIFTLVAFSACAFFYGFSIWKAISTNLGTKVERNLLMCAFCSSFPIVVEFVRAFIMLYAALADSEDIYIFLGEWWSYQVDLTFCAQLWVQLIVNVQLREIILPSVFRKENSVSITIQVL